MQAELLIEKIRALPQERIAEIEDFVDFLAEREERRLIAVATTLSEPAFREIWDNDQDADYDRL